MTQSIAPAADLYTYLHMYSSVDCQKVWLMSDPLQVSSKTRADWQLVQSPNFGHKDQARTGGSGSKLST